MLVTQSVATVIIRLHTYSWGKRGRRNSKRSRGREKSKKRRKMSRRRRTGAEPFLTFERGWICIRS